MHECAAALQSDPVGHFWKYRTLAVALRVWHFRENHAQTIYDPNIFSWWSKAATVEFVAVMKCLFGWNTFSTVKTIYAYTPTAPFIVHQNISVFLICISNLHAASHTCGGFPVAHKKTCLDSKAPPPWHMTFLQIGSFSNNASRHHYMPDCNWCLWWCHPPHPFTTKQLAQGHGPPSSEEISHKQHETLLLLCIKAERTEKKQRGCPVKTVVKFECCRCFIFPAK